MTVYHVTFTQHVRSIRATGLRLGQTHAIFAFKSREDAIRWAAKKDWEFCKNIGSGHISILTLHTEADWADYQNHARWLRQFTPVKPDAIRHVEQFSGKLLAELRAITV